MSPRTEFAISTLGFSGIFAALVAGIMLMTSSALFVVYIALGFAVFNLTLSICLSVWYERKGSR